MNIKILTSTLALAALLTGTTAIAMHRSEEPVEKPPKRPCPPPIQNQEILPTLIPAPAPSVELDTVIIEDGGRIGSPPPAPFVNPEENQVNPPKPKGWLEFFSLGYITWK